MPPQKSAGDGQVAFHAAFTAPNGPLSFVSAESACCVVGASVCLWNLRTGEKDYLYTTAYSITKVCGNPARSLLAFCEGGTSPQVFVYSVKPKPKLLYTLSDVTELELADMCFSTCGSRLYVMSKATSKRLSVFSTERGEKLKGCDLKLPMRFDKISVYPGHKDFLAVVRTSSIRLVTIQKSYQTYIANLHPPALPPDSDAAISAFAWATSGHLFFATRQGLLCTMECKTGTIVHVCSVQQPIVSIAVTAQGIITAHVGSAVRFWCDRLESLGTEAVGSLSGAPAIEECPELFELLHSVDLEAAAQMQRPERSPNGQITHLQVMPDWSGAVMMTAEGELWSLQIPFKPAGSFGMDDAEEEASFTVDDMKLKQLTWFHTHAVTDVVMLGASGRLCASGDEGGRLRVWQVSRGSDPKGFRMLTFASAVTSLASDATGELLVVGTDSGCVHVVSCGQWKSTQVLDTLRVSSAGVARICSVTFEGRCMCVAAVLMNHKVAFMTVPLADPKVVMIGLTDVGGSVEDACFQDLSNPGDPSALRLLAVGTSSDGSSGCLWALRAPPLDHEPTAAELKREVCPLWCAKVGDGAAAAGIPTAVASVTDKTAAVGFADGAIRLYSAPQSTAVPSARLSVAQEDEEFPCHEQLVSRLRLTADGATLVSASMDGTVRHTAMQTQKVELQKVVHSPYDGGVVQVCPWAAPGLCVSTGGADGLALWGAPGSTWRPPPEDADADEEMPPISTEIDDMDMEAFPVWAPLSLEEKAQLTEQAADDPEASATAQAHRKALALEVETIRKKLKVLVEENRTCPELEMLERSEFCVDHEEAAKIAANTKERCDTLRAQIERENLARQLVRHRLIKEFWDPMAVKGCKICSLMPESTLSVSNYPVRKETQEEQGIIQKLKVMRRVEQLESQTLRGNHCPRGLQGDALLVADSFSSRQEQYIVNWWPSKTEGDGNQENAKLLYEPFELLTNSRRRLQVFLLQALACDFRLAFNKLFEAAQGDKRATMDQIKEKTARIRAILSELQVDELVEEPRLQDCEDADSVLHVKDGEISVAKWISEEERQRLAEAAAKEEERQRQLRENDAGQRALAQMMGGTLKTKKDLSALEITLDKEPWMDQVPEEDMTELQVAALREFREKEKALAEEQDKYRKQLDAELKRLRQEVQDFTQQFEASLKDLHHQRFAHDAKFFCQELYCVRLQLALLQNLEDHSDVQRIGKDLGEARAQLSKASGELETFQEFIGRARERQDECIRNEKEAASAQNFKQQFAQSGLEPEQIGALLQIFRKKRRMSTQMLSPDATLSSSASPQTRKFRGMSFHGSDTAATKTGPLAPEPFDPEVVMDAYDDLGTVAAESALERAVPKDDEPVDACPEGIDEANYKRMLEMRQRREALEREVAKNSLVLQDMQGLLAHLEKERGDAQVAHDVLQEELDEQLQLMDKELYDIEMLFKLKQGQVEVPQAAVVTDYSDAIVIDQEVVESRNRRIQELGQEKVGILETTKEFRKKLNFIQWEHKMLAMQTTDLEERTKDVHMLRVTKELQSLLKGGEEGKNKADADLLERKIEHLKTNIETKEATLKKQHGMVAQATKLRKAENAMLEKKLRELQQNVIQREHIRRLRAPPGGGAGGATGTEGGKKRIVGGGGRIEENEGSIRQAHSAFKEVKGRQGLMTAVKKHTEEIDILRKELDRLRQKTFPSFVQQHQDRPANPDHVSR